MAPIRDNSHQFTGNHRSEKIGELILNDAFVFPTTQCRRNLFTDGAAASKISAFLKTMNKNGELTKRADPLRRTRHVHWKKRCLKKWNNTCSTAKIDKRKETDNQVTLSEPVSNPLPCRTERINVIPANSKEIYYLKETRCFEHNRRFSSNQNLQQEELIKVYEDLTEVIYQEECQHLLDDLEMMLEDQQQPNMGELKIFHLDDELTICTQSSVTFQTEEFEENERLQEDVEESSNQQQQAKIQLENVQQISFKEDTNQNSRLPNADIQTASKMEGIFYEPFFLGFMLR